MLFLQFMLYLSSFVGTLIKNEIPEAALELCQLKSKQLSADILKFQGLSETLSSQAFKGVKFMAIINASDIFGKFFDVRFFILEDVIQQMTLSVIHQTRASFLWSIRYTQRKINMC